MADVFISYGRGDKEPARALAAALEQRGWSVWWDRQLHTGIQFDREIERQLELARCVVVLWSARSVESNWVRAEASEGLRRGVLLPVALEPIDPPIVFRQTQTLALHGWNHRVDDTRLGELWAAVEWLVRACPRPAPAPHRAQPEWIRVPAGSAALLEGPPQEPQLLAEFRISRFPVTCEQFACFSGEPPEAVAAKLPRVGVSWHDAVAYCRWLSAALGYSVQLPTELQWERAARGDRPWAYPWGESFEPGHCNSREAALGRISEVGRFRSGASPYGVEELSGNVWEWCAPEGGDPDPQEAAAVLCAVRGGSFDLPGPLVRCTVRHFLPARLSAHYVGFRVVAAPRPDADPERGLSGGGRTRRAPRR